MTEVKLHIAGLDDFFAEASQAAARIDAGDRAQQPAVVAFENMEILLKILTANRWRLLRMLRRDGGMSIRRLAQNLGRDYRGVHSDVHALMETGLIDRSEDGQIFVPWEKITAEMSLDVAA